MNEISSIERNGSRKIMSRGRSTESRLSGCMAGRNHRGRCRSYHWITQEKEQDDMQLL